MSHPSRSGAFASIRGSLLGELHSATGWSAPRASATDGPPDPRAGPHPVGFARDVRGHPRDRRHRRAAGPCARQGRGRGRGTYDGRIRSRGGTCWVGATSPARGGQDLAFTGEAAEPRCACARSVARLGEDLRAARRSARTTDGRPSSRRGPDRWSFGSTGKQRPGRNPTTDRTVRRTVRHRGSRSIATASGRGFQPNDNLPLAETLSADTPPRQTARIVITSVRRVFDHDQTDASKHFQFSVRLGFRRSWPAGSARSTTSWPWRRGQARDHRCRSGARGPARPRTRRYVSVADPSPSEPLGAARRLGAIGFLTDLVAERRRELMGGSAGATGASPYPRARRCLLHGLRRALRVSGNPAVITEDRATSPSAGSDRRSRPEAARAYATAGAAAIFGAHRTGPFDGLARRYPRAARMASICRCSAKTSSAAELFRSRTPGPARSY